MTKDKSIIYIVDKIKATPGLEGIVVNDYWEADLFAVSMQKSNVLIYISTWKRPKHHYILGVELDVTKGPKTDIMIDHISEKNLLTKLVEIFEDNV